jgi:hypothetical protein
VNQTGPSHCKNLARRQKRSPGVMPRPGMKTLAVPVISPPTETPAGATDDSHREPDMEPGACDAVVGAPIGGQFDGEAFGNGASGGAQRAFRC